MTSSIFMNATFHVPGIKNENDNEGECFWVSLCQEGLARVSDGLLLLFMPTVD